MQNRKRRTIWPTPSFPLLRRASPNGSQPAPAYHGSGETGVTCWRVARLDGDQTSAYTNRDTRTVFRVAPHARLRRRVPMSTRVLVIDDDSATRVSVRWILEDAGYAVLEAEDGAVALDMLHASPDGLMVLFDYRMPRMNGVELMALAEREQLL